MAKVVSNLLLIELWKQTVFGQQGPREDRRTRWLSYTSQLWHAPPSSFKKVETQLVPLPNA